MYIYADREQLLRQQARVRGLLESAPSPLQPVLVELYQELSWIGNNRLPIDGWVRPIAGPDGGWQVGHFILDGRPMAVVRWPNPNSEFAKWLRNCATLWTKLAIQPEHAPYDLWVPLDQDF